MRLPINPPWEEITTECDVCNSDFGNGPEAVPCLRVRMDHCAALYGCVCLECARAIADAVAEYEP
jgi:hypothetical protein